MKQITALFFMLPMLLWSQSTSSMRESIKIGDTNVAFFIHESAEDHPYIFVNVHEDETTSIETLAAFSLMEPLDYFYIEHLKTRRISFEMKQKSFDFDPNRIFTRKGRRKTLKDGAGGNSWRANRMVKTFAEAILKKLETGKTVVAVHNNTDVNYSIKSYLPNGDEFQNTREVFVNREMDPDDFIYTTVKEFYDAYKERGINVILQDNRKFVNDGSLSVYCGKKGIPYINIETQKGHFDEQMHLIQVTLEVLNENK
jgi:uncharacterized Zn-finger protein